jgi:hypothetical protein
MITRAFKFGALLVVGLASGSAFADDPTGVLEQEQRAANPYARQHYGQRSDQPAFSDVGPCQPGTQSEAFPNAQGFRCVPSYQP